MNVIADEPSQGECRPSAETEKVSARLFVNELLALSSVSNRNGNEFRVIIGFDAAAGLVPK